MSADDRKAHFRRYVDAYNRSADDELDLYVTSDYVHHSNGDALTLEQFKRGAAWLRAAMPDLVVEAVDLVGEGDRVAARWIGRGTHQNSMFGEHASGRQIAIYGITVYRFSDDGRIAEDWEVFDEGDLRRQAAVSTDAT